MKLVFSLATIILLWSCMPQLNQRPSTEVSKVELYRNGVGYFEVKAPVHHGKVSLSFDVDQMDDVLKSLIVRNLQSGKILDISLPLAPQKAQAVEASNWNSLLDNLQGYEMQLTTKFEKAKGRLYGVDNERNQVLLQNANTIKPISLETIVAIDVLDKKWALKFEKNMANHQVQVSINTDANAGDSVLVSYVIPAPRWKATHKLFMDSASSSRALLQSWALVDNATQKDWSQVQLSLTAGEPRSESVELYNPQWVERPSAQKAPPPTPMLRAAAAPMRLDAENQAMSKSSLAGASSDISPKTESHDRAGLNEYRLTQAVNLPAQKSAMIPLVNQKIPVETALLYSRTAQANRGLHPQRVVRWSNTTPFALETAPMGLFVEGSFVGDAQVELTNRGQQSFLPYAVEKQITVHKSADSQWEDYELLKINQGIFTVQRKQQVRNIWEIKGLPADLASYKLYIEQPKERANFTMQKSTARVVDKGDHWLLMQEIKGDSAWIELVEASPVQTEFSINDPRAEQILKSVMWQSNLDTAWRSKLQPLIRTQGELAQVQKQIAERRQLQADWKKSADEIRATLQSVAEISEARPLRNELLRQLEDNLKRNNNIQAQIQQLQTKEQEIQLRLDQIMQSLSL